MTVLAIDQGTSGTKAIVVDPEEGVLGAAEVSVRPKYLPGGAVEQDPAALLDSVLEAGAAAIALTGRPAGDIQAVSLANQGETVLAWDPDTGQPLTEAVVWQDRRAESVCAGLAAHRDGIAARTGLVLDPYFSAPKMAWLRRNRETSGVVTTSDSWLVNRLCGAFVTDVSTASRSLVVDVDTMQWDPELLALFGLGDERLPAIVSNDAIVGTTSAFGGTEIPVGGLVVDQQAALLAESCFDAGMAKCTFGTGAFLLANTGDLAVRSTAGLTSSVAWRTADTTAYCIDGQVYTAASAIRWLNSLGIVDDVAHLDAATADDPGGVICVPALAGLAAPWWRADATATLAGLTLSTDRGQVVLAVLQGIAAQIRSLVAAVHTDTGTPMTTLRVDGGLTRSAALMQACADIVQIPVEIYPSPHATAIGAAALAALSLHPERGVRAVVPGWEPPATFTPQWSAERADEFHSAWLDLAARTYPATEPT